MKGNFAPFVREIRARFLIVFCILLLLVVGSIIYFIYFMQPSGDFSNQQQVNLVLNVNRFFSGSTLDLIFGFIDFR